jgi:acetoin utilization protein AcuB
MKKTAEELMNGHVIYINQKVDLAKAWKMLQDNSIRHLVVLDENHNMSGVLSDRDCLRAMRSQSLPTGTGQVVESIFPSNVIVFEYMRSPVKTVQYDTSVDRIAEVMNEFKISSVVVMSAGRVIGIVTEYDLLRDYVEIVREKAS